jgi:Ras-related protein Rab-7A
MTLQILITIESINIPMDIEEPDLYSQTFYAKTVLLGESSVGKTSIRRSYMGYSFSTSHQMTLGADFSEKSLELNIIDDKGEVSRKAHLTLQIWDLAGQQGFESIRKRFMHGATIIIIVYDRTSKLTFEAMNGWLEEVLTTNPDQEMPLLIVGNKSDLKKQIIVSDQDVEDYIRDVKISYPKISKHVYAINTSALSGENINLLFEKVTTSFLDLIGDDDDWLNSAIIHGSSGFSSGDTES